MNREEIKQNFDLLNAILTGQAEIFKKYSELKVEVGTIKSEVRNLGQRVDVLEGVHEKSIASRNAFMSKVGAGVVLTLIVGGLDLLWYVVRVKLLGWH